MQSHEKHDQAHVEHVGKKHDALTEASQVDPQELNTYVPDTPEEKKLLRKIDLHLLPMLWGMYVFNYIDRTNIGVSSGMFRGSGADGRMPKWAAWSRTFSCPPPTTL